MKWPEINASKVLQASWAYIVFLMILPSDRTLLFNRFDVNLCVWLHACTWVCKCVCAYIYVCVCFSDGLRTCMAVWYMLIHIKYIILSSCSQKYQSEQILTFLNQTCVPVYAKEQVVYLEIKFETTTFRELLYVALKKDLLQWWRHGAPCSRAAWCWTKTVDPRNGPE